MVSDVLIKENKNNKPFVRIIEAELDNFKIVGHGEIVFSCGKEKVPYNTKSDILGIYGQNGSGKTSFIEALDILRILMSGGSIPDYYSDCIAKDKEYAKVSFTFDFQYPNGIVRTVKYEFKLKIITSNENLNMDYENDDINISALDDRYKNNHIQVFDEIVFVTGPFGDKSIKMQSIMDTSLKDDVFGPVTKRKFFIDLSKYKFSEIKKDLVVYKKLALEKSQSFIFMDKVLNIFQEKGNDSDFFHVLLELKHYASYFLKVIRTKDYAIIRAGRTSSTFELPLPIYFRLSNTDKPMLFKSGIIVSEKLYEKLDILFSNMNLILKELIPSIDIKLKKLSPALLKSGEAGFVVDLVSIRYGIELPIRVESDGIKKLISSLNLIIEVFHNPYLTIVIDEFDAGVFEYLLGDLLKIFESNGKGQFIFTSHNLHPLEVIKNKRFLIFTTTNPQNRYIHFKNIYPTHNLRDRYYNEISNERDEMKNEQDEILYKQSKINKIIEAFKKAGSTQEFDGLGLPLKMDIC